MTFEVLKLASLSKVNNYLRAGLYRSVMFTYCCFNCLHPYDLLSLVIVHHGR
jgi:hypothetical protein